MAKVAFILLCHKDPTEVIAQAERLTASGDYVAIHFDGRAKASDFALMQNVLRGNDRVAFAAKRIKCGWGAWSLVEATLQAVRAAAKSFPLATHFYMMSGDCMPVKSAEYAHDFLDSHDVDYIESFDFHKSDWIKTGFKDERLIYRHWFNERTQPKRFYASYHFQRRFGITREVPSDLQMMIGSQWWCLRRTTIEKILEFCAQRRDVMRFFATTWIPDETFFQTLVRHLVPRKEIEARTLTYLIFTDYGMPVVFCNDHYSLLIGQDYLFARKISPEASELKSRLGMLWLAKGVHFPVSGDGKNLFRFLTERGRIGRRFAPRFWETDGSLELSHQVLMVVCKKWHIAKRLTQAIREHSDIPAVDYLFNEVDANLPDLGGVEKTVEKRERHRRALIRLLFDQFEDPRLVICLDTSALGLMTDLVADKAETRILLIETEFGDDYVQGHVERLGLAGKGDLRNASSDLVTAVRGDLRHESDRLREMNFSNFYEISASRSTKVNADRLAGFLDIDLSTATDIINTPYLFDD